VAEPAKRNSRASIDRLREAARELFVSQGYHNTRPQDIARAAGVAHGTFYLHFKDKQEAFLDFAEHVQNELLDLNKARLEGVADQKDRWAVVFDGIIDFGRQEPGLLHAAFFDPLVIAPKDKRAWDLYDRMGHLTTMVIGKEAAEKLGHDPQLISHGVCGMFRQSIIYAFRNNMNREELIAELSSFIDRALALNADGDNKRGSNDG
jgi:AcrR family transcriptional regulator